MNKIRELFGEEEGQAMVEYTLILAVLLLGAITFFSGSVAPTVTDYIKKTMTAISKGLE